MARLEIAVRRGDQPQIHRHLAIGPDRTNRARLERSQELRLEPRRHLADLVEEERAAGSLDQEAVARAASVGERALGVAEELALEQASQATAAQLTATKGPFAPRALLVKRARDELLAGAGLAGRSARSPRSPRASTRSWNASASPALAPSSSPNGLASSATARAQLGHLAAEAPGD